MNTATSNSRPAALRRQRMAGLDLTVLEQAHYREVHLTLRPLPHETPGAMFDRLSAILKEHDASVVRHEVFGSLIARPEALRHLRKNHGEVNWPVCWLEGGPCGGNPLAGTHVFAVSGLPVQPLTLGDRLVGRTFSDGRAQHYLFGDLGPVAPGGDPARQTEETYANLLQALDGAGLNFGHVVRTWFFLDNILAWYGDFNRVRNEFFRQQHLRNKPLPASTGIATKNPDGAALSLGAWAVKPLDPALQVLEVFSPLQCPAPSYGSGFSRAMEIATPGYRRLLVSGTASINPDGASARHDDIDGQIELTMEVVQSILSSREMTLADVTRATAYFKSAQEAPAFARWCAAQGVKPLPIVLTEAAVCRDELLFEIELDLMATGDNRTLNGK